MVYIIINGVYCKLYRNALFYIVEDKSRLANGDRLEFELQLIWLRSGFFCGRLMGDSNISATALLSRWRCIILLIRIPSITVRTINWNRCPGVILPSFWFASSLGLGIPVMSTMIQSSMSSSGKSVVVSSSSWSSDHSLKS